MGDATDEVHVGGRHVRRGSVGDLGFRVARALYGRWRKLSSSDRTQLEPLAEDVRRRALDLRGESDSATAARGLEDASQRLADGLVDTASADPQLSRSDVQELRDDLARELARLASADVQAGRLDRAERAAAQPKPDRSG